VVPERNGFDAFRLLSGFQYPAIENENQFIFRPGEAAADVVAGL
jgi:hypothetical protein